MTKVLLDTDVILYFFFNRKPHSEDTAKILSLCESRKIKGYVTPVIISNLYYLLRKTAPHEQVIAQLRLLLSITDVLVIDKVIILQAMNSSFRDFEDALQNYSAETDKTINIILTRNIKDYKGSMLSIQTPETFLKAKNY